VAVRKTGHPEMPALAVKDSGDRAPVALSNNEVAFEMADLTACAGNPGPLRDRSHRVTPALFPAMAELNLSDTTDLRGRPSPITLHSC
jgi:hypothetical protein